MVLKGRPEFAKRPDHIQGGTVMARVPYLTREDFPAEKQAIYDQIARHRGSVERPFQALLNSPELGGRVASVGEYLRFNSILPNDVREITTLAVAQELGSQYEWERHLPLARSAGVREEVIDAIRDGTPLRRLMPKEAVFVQIAQELLREKKVRAATYSAVEHLLERQGVVELVVTVAYYALLAYVMHALEIEAEV